MPKNGFSTNGLFVAFFLIITLFAYPTLAIEVDFWIEEQVELDGYYAEQGVDYQGGYFYTSNTALVLGSISVFDQNWELLQTYDDFDEHIGDITVVGDELVAPLCSSSDQCVIRRYQLDNGLISGITLDHDISDLGFEIAGMDYDDNIYYGVEYSENGTAFIVQFSETFEYDAQYEITSLYANGIEIASFDSISERYVFISRGDIGVNAYVDIYRLYDLQESELNEPIYTFEYPTNIPLPFHAEGLTIDENQIWLAQGNIIYLGFIDINEEEDIDIGGDDSADDSGGIGCFIATVSTTSSSTNANLPTQSADLHPHQRPAKNI